MRPFSEYLKTRWPVDHELIAAFARFTRDPVSPSEAIRILATHRQLNGLDKTVQHFERQSIHAHWRDFEKRKREDEQQRAGTA